MCLFRFSRSPKPKDTHLFTSTTSETTYVCCTRLGLVFRVRVGLARVVALVVIGTTLVVRLLDLPPRLRRAGHAAALERVHLAGEGI